MPNSIYVEREPNTPTDSQTDPTGLLWFYRELVNTEKWLRTMADCVPSTRASIHLDRAADNIERAANRVKDCLDSCEEVEG